MAERLSDLQEVRVSPPPPVQDKDMGQFHWERVVTDEMNRLPSLSVFSFSTPNSNVTANPSTLGFNLGTNVASSVSALWIKQVGSGNTGWAELG